MSKKMQRRRFMQSSAAAAGAGFYLTAGYELPRAQARQAANERLNVAVIGCGGRGSANLGGVSGENIVALCDVDQRQAAGAYRRYPKVPKYDDFRVMLDKQKDIEAVVVSTPDHTHAIASITAMRMGKHCYCEKPLTHSIYEARMMREVAAKNKVATQMGNQGTSTNGLRESVEIVRSGAIGDVREVHVWTNRPIWPQNIGRPKGTQPVPDTLKWDLWLGPAPQRPFYWGNNPKSNRGVYLPFNWRGWWDFGTGALGDMACHTMNMAFMALSLGAPTSVQADLDPKGAMHMDETAPMGVTVTYQFPARGKMPACTLYWYERRYPPAELLQGQQRSGSGSILIGSRGSLYSPSDYGDRRVLLPVEQYRNYEAPRPTLPRSPGHHNEWLRACKGGPPAMSNFVDYASQLTETVLLGNVAMHMRGKRLGWDSAKMQPSIAEANRYIRPEYRKGWTLGV